MHVTDPEHVMPPTSTRHPAGYLRGFPDFSAYVASDPDLEIYRRFNRLSARNILYLQSELLSLEAQLERFDAEDETRIKQASNIGEKMDIWQPNMDWDTFVRRARAGTLPEATVNDKSQDDKYRCLQNLRRVLAEYQDAIIRQSTCLSLPNPGEKPLRAFSDWISREEPLLGQSQRLIDDSRDLFGIAPDGDSDRLSRLLKNNFSYFFQEKRGHPASWGEMYYFRERAVARLVTVVSVLLASILLVGSIVALYHERRPGVRLGILGAFTVAFAASVGLMTNAKRSEVFGTTAAYAAVLVVFVSGTFGPVS